MGKWLSALNILANHENKAVECIPKILDKMV
jgi:hypothetical protein